MRKQERRAWICLMLAMVLIAGIGVFGYRLVKDGGEWATFYGNTQIYTDGYINRGTITDRNRVSTTDSMGNINKFLIMPGMVST